MISYSTLHPHATASIRSLSFIKEDEIWYAHLPEFLENGLGTKANLMMVDGADTFLDLLSNNGNMISLQLSKEPILGYAGRISKIKNGMNANLLAIIGHAPDDYGAYYHIVELHGQPCLHQLWLCPVTEYVFGEYPKEIFFQSLKNKNNENTTYHLPPYS